MLNPNKLPDKLRRNNPIFDMNSKAFNFKVQMKKKYYLRIIQLFILYSQNPIFGEQQGVI